MGFITVESLFRLLVVPWPGKVVIDHVVLGQPIAAGAAGYPPYLAPFVLFLDGQSAVAMMLWILLLGVLMVIVFGSTTNRGAGRSPTGAPTGSAAGASGAASAVLAQGHDTATQTENEANRAGSLMGGILGILDFKVNLRLSQALNHVLRTQLAARAQALPMTTFGRTAHRRQRLSRPLRHHQRQPAARGAHRRALLRRARRGHLPDHDASVLRRGPGGDRAGHRGHAAHAGVRDSLRAHGASPQPGQPRLGRQHHQQHRRGHEQRAGGAEPRRQQSAKASGSAR